MEKEKFRTWLCKRMGKKPAGDCLSRCGTVERSLKIDLDNEFKQDEGKSLIDKLSYTIKDEQNKVEAPQEFHFDNPKTIRTRMANMKNASKRYFEFCKETNEVQ